MGAARGGVEDAAVQRLHVGAAGVHAADDVVTGAEGASGAGHDHGAHVAIAAGGRDPVGQAVHHLLAQRVEPIGAVERDRQDAVGELPPQPPDLGVSHVTGQPTLPLQLCDCAGPR